MADRPVHARDRGFDDQPPVEREPRTGDTRIERMAIARVRVSIAAMPASLVVQLALWPDELARWARAERVAESVVYNLLARRKPYLRIRERLAAHLSVPTGHLAMLVDGTPHGSDPPVAPEPADGTSGWRRRSGTNPLERRAVERVEREVAAMPAATVVGLAIWPESLTEWARTRGLHPSAVWATLAGAPSEQVATALARRLDVSVREVVALIEAERRIPGVGGPPIVAPAGTLTAVVPLEMPRAPEDAQGAVDDVPSRPERRSVPRPPARDQLSLGL
ncbi:MAG: hypothetical protein ACXW0Z_00485 [Gemmatirosa sp.]